MKKGLLLLTLLVSFVGFGQCPSDYMGSQTQIDNFATDYPNCTSMDRLDIQGENITDLSGLAQLVQIGVFEVQFTSIQNFNGLSNLERINLLKVQYNDDLVDFSGLTALTTIGYTPYLARGFKIYRNDNLTSLQGLETLTTVDFLVDILENHSLQNLNGLNGLTTVNGNFNILDTHLVNLNGLENLSLITETLTIKRNNSLTSLSGLEGLHEISEYLQIGFNPYLQNLDGLQNLVEMGPDVGIYENLFLSSIDGLSNINPTNFTIRDNRNLSICAIAPVCEALAQSGQYGLLIVDNATGCNSNEQVEAQCQLVISEEDFSQSLSFFPNPVSSILQIKTSNTLSFEKVTVYSLLGQKILQTSEKEINLESLSAGIYLVEVVTDKGTVTKRIIKE